jgi:hypothetical protein
MDAAMSRQAFLANPIAYLSSTANIVPPPEWVRESWPNLPFRNEAVASLSRSVSKTGSLIGASDWLLLLGPALPPGDAAELYTSIRDRAERSESEWRNEFELRFPQAGSLLPPIDLRRELFNKTLAIFCAIYWLDLEAVKRRVQLLLNAGFRLNDAKMSVAELGRFPEGVECLVLVGPRPPDSCLSVLFLAMIADQGEIVDYLRANGATE